MSGVFWEKAEDKRRALYLGSVMSCLLLTGAASAQPAGEQVPMEIRVSDGPGACHAKAYFKSKTETYVEQVLVSPGSNNTRIVDPVTNDVETQVVVTPERRVKRIIPAVMKEVVETVIITPETTKEIVEPAVYQTQTKRVIVQPVQGEWVVRRTKNGRAIQPVRDASGRVVTGCETAEKARNNKACDSLMPSQDVYQYKQTEPVYGTVTEQVLVSPEQRRTVTVPAATKEVKRTVVETPAQTVWVTVPAVTRTERNRVVETPGRTETVSTPAEYRDETRVRTVPGEAVWRKVVCPRDINPYLISQVQLALAINGYNPREFNGVLTRNTQEALERYQHGSGLPAGPLTLETLKLLSVTVH